ncbi:MAG TPA: hypothetical protein VIG30_17350 [Ktedonobacterales bacterium]
MHKYRPLVFAGLVALCVLGFVLLGIASDLPHVVVLDEVLNAVGSAVLVADMILVLVADPRGFITLNGRIDWAKMSETKRFCLGCLAVIFSPLLLVVYLIQIARHATAASPAVPPEVQQYLRDGDLGALKQRVSESLTRRP